MSTTGTQAIDPTIALQRLARNVTVAIESTLSGLVAGLLVVLLVVVMGAVVLRYVFGTGVMGAEDLGIWLHVAMIAFGAPLALRTTLAMRLEVFVERLPAAGRSCAAVLADVYTVVTALVLIFGGVAITARLGGISPTLGLPEWLRFGALGFGGLLLLVVFLLERFAEGRVVPAAIALAVAVAVYVAVPRLAIPTDVPPSLVLAGFAAIGLVTAAPLPHAFLAAAYLSIAFGGSLPEPTIVSAAVTGVSKFLLLAIPFFLLAGSLLTVSGAADRLVTFAAALVGHRRAGLAQTALLTGVLFSGASGSSVANAAFGAATFQPELVRNGYPPAQAGAIIAATSVLDNVIPPSVAFLVLAAATNLSVGSLLVGGFFAGGVMAVCLAIAIHLTVRRTTTGVAAGAAERRRATIGAIPAFGLGFIVVAGIRMGVVTTTEAAALAAIYTLGLAFAARVSPSTIFAAFRKSAAETSAIGMLIGTAGPFAFLLAVDDVAGLISQLTNVFGGSALAVLAVSNVLLFVVGLFLDISAALLLMGPILLPSAVAAGIDPTTFGVIVVVNLMIHGLTPPLGLLIFVVSGVTHVPAAALFRAVLPYLGALLVSLVLISSWALIG